MSKYSLGDWTEDSVGVFVDAADTTAPIARIVNPRWPSQTQMPQDLLTLVRHGHSLDTEQVIAIRRALMNYISLMQEGALSGQQDPDNDLWTEEYVEGEIDRCQDLLDDQFRVTW